MLARSRCRKSISFAISSHIQKRCFVVSRPVKDRWDDESNDLLLIKPALQDLGYRYWGYTVYRCTYSDDEAWSRFMATLYNDARENLEYSCTEELMDSLNYHVHEDTAILDGASKKLVRRRFREWVHSPEAMTERVSEYESRPKLAKGWMTNPRHEYCVHVDEEAMRSVLSSGEGYVNLVKADWALPNAEEAACRRRHSEAEDPFDDGEESIEGCTMHDVGWMKIGLYSLTGAYVRLNETTWDISYMRPPSIATWV
jgi:hypothetical protein